jgi:hypothetical protein
MGRHQSQTREVRAEIGIDAYMLKQLLQGIVDLKIAGRGGAMSIKRRYVVTLFTMKEIASIR